MMIDNVWVWAHSRVHLGDVPTWLAFTAALILAQIARKSFKAQNAELDLQRGVVAEQTAQLRQIRMDSEWEYHQKKRAQALLVALQLIHGEQRLTPVRITAVVTNNSQHYILEAKIMWFVDYAPWIYNGSSEDTLDALPAGKEIELVRTWDRGNLATLEAVLTFTDASGIRWYLKNGQLEELASLF